MILKSLYNLLNKNIKDIIKDFLLFFIVITIEWGRTKSLVDVTT